jgi:prolipoprotein diacylglyceryl transferase
MEFGREFITLFDRVQVRYYGLIIVAAMLVAAWVAARLAKRDRRDPDHIWGALTWAIIPAIIGARLWFILFPPESLVAQGQTTAWFFENFLNAENGAIAIWSGGLHLFGALLGGALGASLYFSRWHNAISGALTRFWWVLVGLAGIIALVGGLTSQPEQTTWAIVVGIVLLVLVALWLIPPTRAILERIFGDEGSAPFPDEGISIAPWLDIAGICLPLGQAIGRFANYVNQELYGIPTTLPWGITIDSANRVGEYRSLVNFPTTTLFHPLFMYEALWNVLAFAVLLNLYLRNRSSFRPGDFFLLYIMQYAFIRFLLEFLRVEISLVAGFNFTQLICVIAFIIALALFALRHRTPQSVGTPSAA